VRGGIESLVLSSVGEGGLQAVLSNVIPGGGGENHLDKKPGLKSEPAVKNLPDQHEKRGEKTKD